jgi:hypothetical protein
MQPTSTLSYNLPPTVAAEAVYVHMKAVPAINVPTWNLTPASALVLAPK